MENANENPKIKVLCFHANADRTEHILTRQINSLNRNQAFHWLNLITFRITERINIEKKTIDFNR